MQFFIAAEGCCSRAFLIVILHRTSKQRVESSSLPLQCLCDGASPHPPQSLRHPLLLAVSDTVKWTVMQRQKIIEYVKT